MKVYSDADIIELGVTPRQCVEWARQSLCSKPNADLPPKTWQHFPNDVFVNTMPCYVPEIKRYGVKVVTRHPGCYPALKSKILLVDMEDGNCLACMDGNWITAMRTGAVAALAGKTFTNNFKSASFGFVGLGSMARSTMECLCSLFDCSHDIWLLRYKDQAEKFIDMFAGESNLMFHITDSREELIDRTDALFSCVTVMNEQFLPASFYPKGYTLIPVHTRGFQDCDIVFDRIFGDDTGHLKCFQHFSEFKSFNEFTDVLLGNVPGRKSADDRIISYNIGLGLHDVWFASNIYDIKNGLHNNE
jgi:ornithine cyclodeaminase/alanine dehydrogenase-like protein (mu-crystallin family)